jgi:hypothetical protein
MKLWQKFAIPALFVAVAAVGAGSRFQLEADPCRIPG